MVSDELREDINSAAPPGVTHIGFVVTNAFGQYLVTEPQGHPSGVVATLCKVKVQPGEQPFDSLVRCLREQIGENAIGVYPIPTVWSTSNSAGFYFAGLIWNEGAVAHSGPHYKVWCDIDDARRRISSSHNAESKRRDLALLDAASAMCLSPYRRVLLMVRELHLIGFERLRAPAYEYPLAWRCPVLPAHWTLKSHGGMFDDPSWQLERLLGVPPRRYCYSSASGQFPFGWKGVAFDSPSRLARRFIRRRREIALAGWGPDPEYVRWFEQALEATWPNGIFAAFGEFEPPGDALYTLMARVPRVGLPPPGWAEKGEYADHFKGAVQS